MCDTKRETRIHWLQVYSLRKKEKYGYILKIIKLPGLSFIRHVNARYVLLYYYL